MDYFPDILRIIRAGGSQHHRRQVAEDVLDNLITGYRRLARALPKASRSRLVDLPIFEFLGAIKDRPMRVSTLTYMAEVSGSDISIDAVASLNMPSQVPWLDGFVPRVSDLMAVILMFRNLFVQSQDVFLRCESTF